MSEDPIERRAVAVEYDAGRHEAPVVSASGQGRVAEEILRLARESQVPVIEDRDLVGLLGRLEVGEAIPPDLYLVVAEILAFVYRLNRASDSGLRRRGNEV